jgi:hypothetical protein
MASWEILQLHGHVNGTKKTSNYFFSYLEEVKTGQLPIFSSSDPHQLPFYLAFFPTFYMASIPGILSGMCSGLWLPIGFGSRLA